MVNRVFYLFIWITFTVYGFGFAPESQPDTLTLIQNLSTGHWSEINPWIISLFNAMGLWPILYTALLLRDGQKQKFPAWPFAVGSFFVGAFAVLPYLILRTSNPEQEYELTQIKGWESRVLAIAVSIGFLVLLGFGFSQGNWSSFTQQWYSDRFIHVMSLDFCMLSILMPSLTLADRQGRETTLPIWVDFIPAIGGLAYLCFRGPVQLSSETQNP